MTPIKHQPAQVQAAAGGRLEPWQAEAFTKLVMGEAETLGFNF